MDIGDFMTKKKIVILIMSILLIILGISAFNITKWAIDNKTNDNIIKEIDKIVTITEIDEAEDDDSKDSNLYYDYRNVSLIDVDFKELKKINSQTKGWVQVKGTNINYPYVQAKDNEYYLNRSFDKKYTDAGWVFIDYRNNTKEFDKNTLLFAHARKNNTMFGELDNLLKKKHFEDEENNFIKISTEEHNSVWQIFSVYHIPTNNDYMQIEFANDNEFLSLVKTLKKRSYYNFKVDITKNDKILTLSTCYNDEEKLAVHAKLIKIQNK